LIAVGAVMALYAHNLAFVTLLAGNVYFLLRREWGKELRLIAGQCIGLVMFAPWLMYVPTQLEKIQRAFWTQTPGLLDAVQMLMVFTTYLPLPPALIVAALAMSLLLLVVVVWQLAKLVRRESGSVRQTTARTRPFGVVVAFAVIPPIVLFVLSYLIRPVFVPRGAIVSGLAYAMLLGVVVARAPRRVQYGAVAASLLAAVVLLPFYYSAFGEWRRAPLVEVNAFLRAHWREGDVVLHDNKLAFLPMHLYDRDLPQVFLADPPESDNDTFAPGSQEAMELYPVEFEAVIEGHPRVWFVIYHTAIEEAEESETPHGNMARLERFERMHAARYGDLDVILYSTR
jgi:hypothetical protein